MADRLKTLKEIAEYLNVDEQTIYRMVRKKDIPGVKVRGNWRFKQEEIDEWLKEKGTQVQR